MSFHDPLNPPTYVLSADLTSDQARAQFEDRLQRAGAWDAWVDEMNVRWPVVEAGAVDVWLAELKQRYQTEAATTLASGKSTPVSVIPRLTNRSIRNHWSPLWTRTAMVGGMAALVILGLIFGVSRFVSGLRTANTATPVFTSYVTHRGQRADVTLADGTHVTLDVASQLDVPIDFATGDRSVRLHGEAYFDVAHVNGHPFIVEAAGTRTRVLGTQFGIRAYRADSVMVAVRSGKVTVGPAVLGAHDVAYTQRHGPTIVTRNQDVDAALGFVQGQLVLSDLRLRDAIPDLDRWYDVDIQLADFSFGEQHLSMTLSGTSIEELMYVLHLTFDARVVRQGRTLILHAEDTQ